MIRERACACGSRRKGGKEEKQAYVGVQKRYKPKKRGNKEGKLGLQQMQEVGSLGEYGYLSKHENVFLAEEEV